ncbi:hypothetical protein [Flavobacterium sp. LMO8]|uniref:hypothetical protein n=1 Tax=Flavobacterium sp. LMO8 TaxID=2654244 RepID=UPI0012920778|nr:hypothetical protein [Flavobacterium sp. LMO8]
MKNKILLLSLLILLLTILSCGPRRYKCGPNRRCDNSIKKTEKHHNYKEFDKTYNC